MDICNEVHFAGLAITIPEFFREFEIASLAMTMVDV